MVLDGVSLYPATAENNTSLQLHSNCLYLVRYVLSDSRNNDPVKKKLDQSFSFNSPLVFPCWFSLFFCVWNCFYLLLCSLTWAPVWVAGISMFPYKLLKPGRKIAGSWCIFPQLLVHDSEEPPSDPGWEPASNRQLLLAVLSLAQWGIHPLQHWQECL